MSDVKRPAVRAWLKAADEPWAITEEALRQVLDIAARATAESWEAVAAKIGKPLENTWSAEIRDGVAIVPVMGPIFRYANLFTMFSGGTSVQDLATDFQAALDNPDITAILLNVDSPGGEVAGINEMATMIRAAREKKPVVAYVGGMMASAAYWLGSQASEIVADATAIIGSIGVVATFRDRRGADEKAGIATYEIVSSQSPRKRPDLATEDGRSQIRALLDGIAEEFVGAVATGRGVTPEKVLADFGQGGSMAAKSAMAAGMIDRLGSLEGMIAEMSGGAYMPPAMRKMMAPGMPAPLESSGGSAAEINVGGPMAEEKKPAEQKPAAEEKVHTAAELAAARTAAHAEGVTGGTKTERERIGAILGCAEAKGRENLARTIALETDSAPEAAQKLLSAAPMQEAPRSNPLAAAMASVPNPAVGAGAGEANEEAALVASILSAGKPKKEGK